MNQMSINPVFLFNSDNHYVPNLTIGPMVCKALRDHGVTKDIDVHLMVQPVDAMITDFAKAGASYITFHPEVCLISFSIILRDTFMIHS